MTFINSNHYIERIIFFFFFSNVNIGKYLSYDKYHSCFQEKTM